MAFGGFSKGHDGQPLAEINMIPLIDVMLVLLVIFIITAPLLTHAVKVELPQAVSAPDAPEPESVRLSIDARGQVYWNDAPVVRDDWQLRMRTAANAQPQPELRIRADGEIAYRHVAQVMADAARAGLNRIGFVTDPNESGADP